MDLAKLALLVAKYIQPAFRKPQGLSGALVMNLFERANREIVNKSGNDFIHSVSIRDAISRLKLEPNETLLEVGFGTGAGIEAAAMNYPTVKVIGIDFSQMAIDSTAKRVHPQIQSGQVQLLKGDALSIPLPDESVDKIVHMNVCYFFDPLDLTLKELRRVLKPGGVMLSGTKFHIVGDNDPSVFKIRSKSVYIAALHSAGFRNIVENEVRFGKSEEEKRYGYQAIVAVKPVQDDSKL